MVLKTLSNSSFLKSDSIKQQKKGITSYGDCAYYLCSDFPIKDLFSKSTNSDVKDIQRRDECGFTSSDATDTLGYEMTGKKWTFADITTISSFTRR